MTTVEKGVSVDNVAKGDEQSKIAPSASLYVGELDPSVTEAMLFEMFNMIGPVASIRVCRDSVTRQSLGYAYVNFHTIEDAESAIDSLNYSLIKGRACRIMWSQRDPALRKTGSGNIFIKNLDASIDNKALHDTFAAFGNILSCKIAQDKEGKSKGYGFVHYESQEDADMAMKRVNGMLLNDKKVYVGHYISNKDRHSRNQGIQFTNVYVKNLAPDVTEDDLATLFGKFGTITSTHVERDHTNMSRGFGFVNFENYEDAAESVERLTETEFHGQQLYVSRAQKKGEREEELRRQYEQARQEKVAKYQGVNLYVKNLEDTVDDDALCNEFSSFGTITSAKVMRDEKTGTSRCFGFVCFSTPEEAIRAVAEMNGRMIGSKPIYVAPAQRKEVRRSQLEVQMSQRGQMRPPMNPGFGGGAPPMFYGNHPQGFNGQRPMYVPNNMMARPRWAPVQQQGFPNQGYPMHQRPPREPRPPRATNKAPSEDQASGNDFDGPASSTASALASVPPEAQKQVLGERLYPIVNAQEPEYAGKITGMLLEMDNTELLNLLDDHQTLNEKVQEALQVLKQHLSEAE